ncbi:MAG: ABC transporter permease [Kiritimatiellae bacterium]|nr:ABC transporter permease [Kiritimatiellia bacterium]MDD2347020.1 ABC transporter permease [Kiritimatiellia bacterium]MDD3583389.1 ABC transporter permease [Kiritimatiellia bacterium]
MNLLEMARTVYASLTRHLVRSLLATLGIVLGIAAVVAMLAIGEGGRREALHQIESQGVDNIILRSVKPAEGNVKQTTRSYTQRYGITQRDVEHIAAVFENVRLLVPVMEVRREIFLGQASTDIKAIATTPDFLEVTRCRLVDRRSRFLAPTDGKILDPICVVGVKAARRLFGHRDPIGQTIAIGNASFRVVGLMESPGGGRIGGQLELNNIVCMPLETATSLWGGITVRMGRGMAERVDYDYLYLAAKNVNAIPSTAGRLRTYLRETHAQVDYEVQVPYELLQSAQRTQRIFTVVMTSIAAISLLVGGIGIMNIMLANIFERTREIGVRRALGARKRDILWQFLAESVLLTSIGGGLGAGLGIATAAAAEWISRMGGETGLKAVVTSESLIVALAVSVITGITFGTHPAWKAAQLDPLTALRHE